MTFGTDDEPRDEGRLIYNTALSVVGGRETTAQRGWTREGHRRADRPGQHEDVSRPPNPSARQPPDRLHRATTADSSGLHRGSLPWDQRRTTCPARWPPPAPPPGSALPTARFSSCISAKTTSRETA